MKQFNNITIKLFIAVLSLGLFLTLGTTSVRAASVTWDGGASGGWNTATNWTPLDMDKVSYLTGWSNKVQ